MSRPDYLTPEVLDAVKFAARTVWRRYRGYIEVDDLVTEGALWVTTHPNKVREIFRDGEEWTEKRAWGRLHKQLCGQMSRVARLEKAHATGYEPEDEEFYRPGVVEDVLRAVLSGDAAYLGPESGEELERVSSGAGDPAEGNSWPVLLADVRGAWVRATSGEDPLISFEDRWFLTARLGSGMTFEQIGRAKDCSAEWARRRVQRCISLLCEDLNGIRPLENDPDIEYQEASGE